MAPFRAHNEAPYDQTVARPMVVLFSAGLAVPAVGHAQTFKIEKFDIKGDGGTDYVAVEAATGRVFVSRGTHMMVVRRRHRQGDRRHPEHARRARRRHRDQGGPRLHHQRRRRDGHDVRS